MKTHQRAFGIAVVTAIAALMGFITPDANGTPNIVLPSLLLSIGLVSGAAGVVGRNGSTRMRAWVNRNF